MFLRKFIINSRTPIRNFSSEKLVSVTINDKNGVAIVNLQRPPVNSLNLEILTELSQTFTELERNKSRGLILKSANDGVFSAGLDIFEMYKPNPERARQFWNTLQDVWIKLYGFKAPTVACINGHSPAGGCLLALSCEYRVMHKNKTIGLNETKLGIGVPFWFQSSMENVIGARHTELSLISGKMHTTDEAFKIGLIDEIAENTQDALEKSQKFMDSFKGIPLSVRGAAKLKIRQKTIDELIKNKVEDTNEFVQFLGNDAIQNSLEMYLQQMKKKQ